jgi:anti-anti-sigma factor
VTEGLVGLDIAQRGEVVVARVTGELDIAESASTGETIAEAVPTSARGLVIDCSGLEFIDSSGIAMLFGLARRLGSRRQLLRIVVRDGEPVARVLQIVEFDRAAPIHPDLEAAMSGIE